MSNVRPIEVNEVGASQVAGISVSSLQKAAPSEGLTTHCGSAMAVSVAAKLTFHGLALTGGVVSFCHGGSRSLLMDIWANDESPAIRLRKWRITAICLRTAKRLGITPLDRTRACV